MKLLWPIERLRCWIRGHRGLQSGVVWAAELPAGRVRELHFCEACQSFVWIESQASSAQHAPTWRELKDYYPQSKSGGGALMRKTA